MNKLIIIPLIAIIFFLIDLYVFQGIKVLLANVSPSIKKGVTIAYWGLFAITIILLFIYHFGNADKTGRIFRNFIMAIIFVNYFSKLFAVLFLLIDDLVRVVKWAAEKLQNPKANTTGEGITRSDFLVKTALVAAAVPFTGMAFGILVGAHDYRIRRKQVFMPNLPQSFDGIKICQLSDIHSGSFFNKTAVKGGIEMVLREKPDLVFFTGDLVNNQATELNNYLDVFGKIKAPLGVYSILGNHDYGDYHNWSSQEAKANNLADLIQSHKNMGWDILLNENRKIKQGSDEIAIIGVENWGAGRFAKYGKLREAYKGTEEAPIKLLLSHDPSHWDAEVRPLFPDIDLTFSGHTHGFQFGVEIGNVKWSPSQYVYKQWAGLYNEANQHLYVNRGFGYLGFPGRIGMPPEITIIELKKT
ncbi:MAG: metallophosphoesterase [Bacteroidota bacterium]|nr:metallophosphoesterase [Bacteroidota bacterium]